jgi:hypothetical protein
VQVPDPAPTPPTRPIVDRADGDAMVATHTVVHGRAGTPEWGVVLCDLAGADGARCYARLEDPDLLADAMTTEWTGRPVTLAPHPTREGANLVIA